MKILVVSPKNKTVFNFRGDLIKEMIRRGNEVIVTGPNQDFIDDVKNLGVSFIEVPFVKDNVGIKGDLNYCNMLTDIIRREKPDKIFSYTIKPVIYSAIAAGRCGVKEVYPMLTGLGRVYAGNGIKTKMLRVATKILYTYALSKCKKVIFQNWDDLNMFVDQKYLPREKCEKIDGSGVNMERFTFSELPEEKTFLMISRIIKEKGVFEFCEAAEIVKEKHPDARFILLGAYDNSIGAISPEELKKYTENETVEIPGVVKDVVPIIEKAYSLVLPTYYREGIPRAILEGMACGKPILTTDWVGTREAVEDGVNGYLVPIKDGKALAEKMIALIEKPEMAQEMGNASYKMCKEKFEVGIINEKMIDIMGM